MEPRRRAASFDVHVPVSSRIMLKRAETAEQSTKLDGDAPLRILIAGYRSHPYVGGQGVYVRELSQALADAGHEVHVASGPPYPHLDPRVRLIRLPSLDLFSEKNALFALRPRHLRRLADISEYVSHNTGGFGEMHAFGLRLQHYLDANPGRYDVIHDNQSFSQPLLAIARRHAPVVATLHHPITRDLQLALDRAPGMFSRLLLKRWHAFVKTQTRVARALPHILTVSEASKRASIEDFGLRADQLHVSHNGVDHDVFCPARDTAFEPGLIVTAASADTPLKGLEHLIRALPDVLERRPDARLTVIGRLREGPAKKAMEALGLEQRIDFVSGLETAEVADLYRRAHVVAAPSLFEGFGFPAAEAMACGAAVVSSDGGALPEVVGPEGRIVPAKNPAALAAALADVLTDDAERRRLSEYGLKRARSQFRWDRHARDAVTLYRQAIAHAHSLA